MGTGGDENGSNDIEDLLIVEEGEGEGEGDGEQLIFENVGRVDGPTEEQGRFATNHSLMIPANEGVLNHSADRRK